MRLPCLGGWPPPETTLGNWGRVMQGGPSHPAHLTKQVRSRRCSACFAVQPAVCKQTHAGAGLLKGRHAAAQRSQNASHPCRAFASGIHSQRLQAPARIELGTGLRAVSRRTHVDASLRPSLDNDSRKGHHLSLLQAAAFCVLRQVQEVRQGSTKCALTVHKITTRALLQ